MSDHHAHQKINKDHLCRNAYLYVRQSTLRQVLENQESTKRQYALKNKAISLGWPIENIVTIDTDQGKSGASTDRAGFQKLVSEVGLGKAGIVIGLEVSRLARNSTDWHRLLEICALTKTLILDEDGLYDPNHFNDRLLLGLKGAMSEAELHVLKSRLQGGIRAKAKRGELEMPVPIGFSKNNDKQVILDPNKQVQESINTFFETFKKFKTASATVKYFQENKLKFPRRIRSGVHKNELVWTDLVHHRALQILHNPRYAGAFFYGRTKPVYSSSGEIRHRIAPQEEWFSLKKDAHKGYISWDRYESNVKQLKENSVRFGHDRRKSPPREGPALLQGLVVCGVCGKRMTLRYHWRKDDLIPDYVCQRSSIEKSEAPCQVITGGSLDKEISKILVESMTPSAIDVALKVQEEIKSRLNEIQKLHQIEIESARYEADVARRRFMQVDPDNRLVADTLEAEWNAKLKYVTEIQDKLEKKKDLNHSNLSEEKQREILKLSTNFPKLWNNPSTPIKEKKQIARLLIEDVTLLKVDEIEAKIRFRGGATLELKLQAPLPAWAIRKTNNEIIKEIDILLNKHTQEEIANILNKRGIKSGTGQKFNRQIIMHLRNNYRLKSLRTRLIDRGYLPMKEIANKLGVSTCTIKNWNKLKLIESKRCSDKNEYVFRLPDKSIISKLKESRKRATNKQFLESLNQKLNEVQYEA